jgi:hypothetical protein
VLNFNQELFMFSFFKRRPGSLTTDDEPAVLNPRANQREPEPEAVSDDERIVMVVVERAIGDIATTFCV